MGQTDALSRRLSLKDVWLPDGEICPSIFIARYARHRVRILVMMTLGNMRENV